MSEHERACRYVSYALPIFCHLTYGKGQHPKGPFNLGALSDVVGWIAVAWVLFITVRPPRVRLQHADAGLPCSLTLHVCCTQGQPRSVRVCCTP